ncbi:hypothetical protein [Microbulbifer sp. 2205BS26-8]|uniref:hypothetical protein n=1 Tax=Microbulbifer sp. 2205BS26-8 TaxID=3064386 RepID=UPI00273DCEDA|nr:hypothetical protein [Microbulbifer sp. 2205BS26-8]MDP5209539.1 hypothetical protein [Microbulbifer sp. 2205BS26-8]
MILKKICTAVCLFVIVSGFAGQVHAETWFPNGAVAMASIDGLEVSKGTLGLTCNLMGAVDLDGENASVGALEVSGGPFNLCGVSAQFENLPYNMEGNADGTVTIQNIYVDGATGDCAGDLTGTFDQSTGILTFDNAALPGVPSGASCVLSGQVSTNPQASYTNP